MTPERVEVRATARSPARDPAARPAFPLLSHLNITLSSPAHAGLLRFPLSHAPRLAGLQLEILHHDMDDSFLARLLGWGDRSELTSIHLTN